MRIIVSIALLCLVSVADAGPLQRLRCRRQSQPQSELLPPPTIVAEAVFGSRSLDGKSFAGALHKQLAAKSNPSLGERRILHILNSPDSPKRDRQVNRMERHVRAHLDLHPTAVIDWSAEIDWPSLLRKILQLLISLLPLLI